MRIDETAAGAAAGLALVLTALIAALETEPPEAPAPPVYAGPSCSEECAPDATTLTPHDCALLAMTRIAAHDGARLGRGHWRVARIIGEVSASCEEAQVLVAVSRQESTWNSREVSHAGACGITQVRSCDAPGTFDVDCCPGYERGGHHCRPTCEELMDTRTALTWTRDWKRERGGWSPEAYFGAPGSEAARGYEERANRWLEIAKGGG